MTMSFNTDKKQEKQKLIQEVVPKMNLRVSSDITLWNGMLSDGTMIHAQEDPRYMLSKVVAVVITCNNHS